MGLENTTEALAAGEAIASGAEGPGAESEQSYFTIGQMARAFDVSLRALRFYEDRGLIHPLRRAQTRLYSTRDRMQLQMILRGKQLGFTLVEIREMLADIGDSPEFELALAPDQILAQIDMLQRQRQDIEKAINALEVTRQRMARTNEMADAGEMLPVARIA